MRAKAFVLIETAVDRTKEVISALKQLEGVKSVDLVTRPYDIIAVIERESLTNISDLVTSKINAVPGISRTVTCLAAPKHLILAWILWRTVASSGTGLRK